MTEAKWSYPKITAHRGAGKLAPENTLAAIRLGKQMGFSMVEIDAKLSADGVSYLLHDDDLNRTTNGQGRASAQNWHNLSQLDAGLWHSKAYAGEGLLSLASLASYCVNNNMLVNVEIKACPGYESITGAAVAEDIQHLWQGHTPPLLSSFSAESLQAAYQVAPELPFGCLFEQQLPPDWLAQCQQVKARAIHVEACMLNASTIQAFKQQGLRIVVWTVNELEQAKQLMAAGVDMVITDNLTEFKMLS